MIRQPISFRAHVILGVVSVFVLLAAYTWLSYRQHQKNAADTTIPNWSQLADGVARILKPQDRYDGDSWLWTDAKATFTRHFTGLAVGVLAAVVIGLAMGCFTPLEALLLPPLSCFAKVPPTAMLAVFFVLVGTGMELYIAMIAFGVIPTLAQSVYQSARADVPEEMIYKAYTLGASHPELIWNVTFKQILPRIIEAVRLQVGPAMVYLIAAEYAVGEIGFGFRLRMQQRLSDMSTVYIYLAILAAVGFLMDYSLTWLRRLLCPWFGK